MDINTLITKMENNQIANLRELYDLAYHYEKDNDVDNMIKCYNYGITHMNDHVSAYCLMKHYYNDGNYDEAIKYMDIMLETDKDADLEVQIMCDLANYLRDDNQINKMKDYLNRLVERGISLGMMHLGLYYLDKEFYNVGEKYLLMAIENGCIDSAYYLGMFYKKIKDFRNMEKIFKLIIKYENNDFWFDTCMELGKYYDNEDDTIHMIKYYMLAYKYSVVNKMFIELPKHVLGYIANALCKENIELARQKEELQIENKELKMENLELKYRPNGIGYEACKKRFYALANQ
jgi:tetratricopeptide (TPR) repeat protein